MAEKMSAPAALSAEKESTPQDQLDQRVATVSAFFHRGHVPDFPISPQSRQRILGESYGIPEGDHRE